jgi:hypothetical protein
MSTKNSQVCYNLRTFNEKSRNTYTSLWLYTIVLLNNSWSWLIVFDNMVCFPKWATISYSYSTPRNIKIQNEHHSIKRVNTYTWWNYKCAVLKISSEYITLRNLFVIVCFKITKRFQRTLINNTFSIFGLLLFNNNIVHRFL